MPAEAAILNIVRRRFGWFCFLVLGAWCSASCNGGPVSDWPSAHDDTPAPGAVPGGGGVLGGGGIGGGAPSAEADAGLRPSDGDPPNGDAEADGSCAQDSDAGDAAADGGDQGDAGAGDAQVDGGDQGDAGVDDAEAATGQDGSGAKASTSPQAGHQGAGAAGDAGGDGSVESVAVDAQPC